jgi:hypothetical protein
LLCPFRFHDEGLVPRAEVPLTGRPALLFAGLLLLPLTGLLWLPFVRVSRVPLLAPFAEWDRVPFALGAPFELQRVLPDPRAALPPVRVPLLGRPAPAGRGATGRVPEALTTPGLAVGVRTSLLVRLTGLFEAEDCPGFRFRDGVEGRLKCGRAPAGFPLAAGFRTGVDLCVWLGV